MTYRGHVENGKVVLAGEVALPEGTEVEVAVSALPGASTGDVRTPSAGELPQPTIEDRIARIMADVPDSEWAKLPADLNDHLDHYIYGAPNQ